MTKSGANNTTRWWIGTLAEATGVTLRTLHHYDEAGLLRAKRSEANHRYYHADDVQRLYKILALKDLGLSLEEIARILDDDQGDLRCVLTSHLQKVREERERLTKLEMSLQHVQRLAEQGVEAHDLIQVIEAMSRVHRHVLKRTPTPDDGGGMEKRWRRLGEELRACVQAGPEARATLEVARKIRESLAQFSQGDETVLAALANLRRLAPPENLAGWDPPLFHFLDLALQALERKESP